MTPYKGILRIECKRIKGGCPRNLRENVKPDCMDCPEAVTQVLDLEGKVLVAHSAPVKGAAHLTGQAEGIVQGVKSGEIKERPAKRNSRSAGIED
jgi:hypothetical protein